MTIQQGRSVEGPRHALLPTARETVEADAAADGVTARICWTTFWLPFAGVAFFGMVFLVARPAFYSLQLEDHVVEWAQFALVLFACTASALAAVQFARSGRPGLAVLMIVVSLGCLALAGEEISWGQRVFGLVTPSELGDVNHQDELNLHNIDVGIDAEDLFKVSEFVMGIVAIALALLARTSRGRLRNTAWWWIAPPLFTLPGFAAIAAYRAVMIVLPIKVNPLTAFQEYVEMTLYFSLAITATAFWLRAARGRYRIDLTLSSPAMQLGRRVSPVLLYAVLAAAAAVTVIFAIMTARSGLLPANLPGGSR